MRGLKYCFSSWARLPKLLIVITYVLSLGAEVLPFAVHEPLGDNEYLAPKIFVFFGAVFFACMFAIGGCRDLSMNKLVRSMPIAKELYTRSVPIFMVFDVVIQTVIMLGYFLFLYLKGAEATQYSDTLIMGAIVLGSMMIFLPLFAAKPAGGLVALYPTMIPILLVMLFCGKERKLWGFGVPLTIAAAVYAGVLVIGIVWAFWISAVLFKKRNVTVYNALAETGNR